MSEDSEPRLGSDIQAELSEADRRELLQTARQILDDYLHGAEFSTPDCDSDVLLQPRASFVTLRRRESGELRGCRGESQPRRPLIESVAQMAIAAATDPRFPPVMAGELALLRIEISVLTPLMAIQPNEVEVGRHGLLISVGPHSGLLLPHVPESQGWGREDFLDGLCRKAGLPADAWKAEGIELYGFEADAWAEED